MYQFRRIIRLAALTMIAAMPIQAAAQQDLDAAQRAFVVESVSTLLLDNYVFADVAAQCADHIGARLAEGAYDNIEDAGRFAEILTEDLRSISHDGHMNVNLYPLGAFNEPDPAETARAQQEDRLAATRSNFGFRRLEWMPGNVGLLEFRSFWDTTLARPTAVSAMNFLANADAIVIDLRSNGGGDPSMIRLISSYFFDEPVHLNTFEFRGAGRVDESWTLANVPGPSLADVPLFILIGSYTYSAAEEFAYNMQALGRATLVGETSGGGAHPTRNYRIDETFAASIPFARAINPITGTNWEGVGVKPDIEVEGDYMAARQVAHLAALEAIEPSLDKDEYRESIRSLIEELRAGIGATNTED